ncbi:MAG: quinoprotein glucose dehydrogenase [Acidimicrobiia bacterium]|nr:quinoprotein glucose dehydrogenase [Acidimicrobiia bacterium]
MPPRNVALSRLNRGACATITLLLGSLVAAQVAPGPAVNPRAVWSEPPEAFTSRVVASGFEDPWDVAWGPDGFLWLTERIGKRVVRVNPTDGTRHVAVTIDEVYQKLAQDGLLGMALHPQLLRGTNHVYVMYTYDADAGPEALQRAKIRRYTYDPASQLLTEPVDLLADIPHGPDHGASRIVFGPDGKLYASRGDHGSNFLAYYCVPIRSQELPTAADINARNWQGYEGKILRLNLDGSIPDDNPVLAGVRSHVFSYGHRNPQGMAFGPDNRLYASEHGQDTDDEVNRIEAGRNYGWPLIAGYRDNRYYTYANWSASSPTPCASLKYSRDVPDTVPRAKESDVKLRDFTPPLKTFFTVPSTYSQRTIGNATAALAGLDVYTSRAIPGWNPSILVAGMISGVIFRMPLHASKELPLTYFKAQDRYRDLAIAPDGQRIYVVTDLEGRTLTASGEITTNLAHLGSLLEFTYAGRRGRTQ